MPVLDASQQQIDDTKNKIASVMEQALRTAGARRLRNPPDLQEADVTLIRFAAASGALGMAR